MIKLVLSDMDNTLNPAGSPHVSERTFAAIHGLLDAGIKFGPSSGRDHDGLTRFFCGDEACYQTGVLLNGKLVQVDGEAISMHYISNDALGRLVDAVRDVEEAFVICDLSHDTLYESICIESTPEQLLWAQRVTGNMVTWSDHVPEKPIIAAVLAVSEESGRGEELRERLAREIPELDLVESMPGWYDVLPHGVNKASGLRTLADALGIGLDEVVVFGDSENDREMLELVPYAVTVANAMPAVYAMTRYHVGACADDGVAIAMEEIVRAQAAGEVPSFLRG